jgi:hypothetical protein
MWYEMFTIVEWHIICVYTFQVLVNSLKLIARIQHLRTAEESPTPSISHRDKSLLMYGGLETWEEYATLYPSI